LPTTLTASSTLPTERGDFELHVFCDDDGNESVVVAVHRDGDADVVPLVRMHSACFTGDVLGSLRCDCGPQLASALRMVTEAPYGILVYLPQHEGRGIGLANKIKAYALQEKGLDTVAANIELGLPADARDFTDAVAALRQLGVTIARLATNNPRKLQAFLDGGIAVLRVPHGGFVTAHNVDYLRVKDALLGHLGAFDGTSSNPPS
jgi:GTP cyclohydrolase II/3,4-dihydroxy 2-butanone 4-phosphate synthase/GTP cyclohydrolase II